MIDRVSVCRSTENSTVCVTGHVRCVYTEEWYDIVSYLTDTPSCGTCWVGVVNDLRNTP